MRVDNQTHWKTADISRLVRACAKFEKYNPQFIKSLRLTLLPMRAGTFLLGSAYLNSNRIKLRLHREAIDPVELAATICHEMAHAWGGKSHKVMGERYMGRGPERMQWYQWSKDFKIESKPIKKKPAPGVIQNAKMEHAISMFSKAVKARKLAEGRARKWAKKVKYYERRLKRAAEIGVIQA